MDDARYGFVAVVPIKPPALGKSRLAPLPPVERARLARAFALDTVTAVLGAQRVSGVLAVTDDFRLAAELEVQGCVVLPDAVSEDLNLNLAQAAREVARRWPEAGLVAICGDLPALRSAELDLALALVPAAGAAYVADTVGEGTTIYAARRLDDFIPAFGPGSAARHQRAGARALSGDWPTLRQDVDQLGDLGRALLLGVGVHTRAASGR
ncbi:2-phospho-L-lactate guanylyltransferase CofC [metagenome]|uniref:2-phospho-L-lactate guanylyltransferase CofC n=1 Tax=metagenome TaxID=256318 RepID=A0A2P2C3R0_9ZZZZ